MFLSPQSIFYWLYFLLRSCTLLHDSLRFYFPIVHNAVLHAVLHNAGDSIYLLY
jgi:hypothetical protein